MADIIGKTITFRVRGTTRQGRVVGTERVTERDFKGRRPGDWLLIRTGLFELSECHHDDVCAVVDVAAVA